MTAKLDDMPNPFCFAASPSLGMAPHNTGERGPSVMPACSEGEGFLPGLQIGVAGQKLDAVRFMHEIMPPGCEMALADDLPLHRPVFLTMGWGGWGN